MQEPPSPPLNTQEFVAKWHSAVEQHLITELTDLLPRLAAAAPRGSDDGVGQHGALAQHLAYALQVAGSSSSGLQEALEYLRLAAGTRDEVPQPR